MPDMRTEAERFFGKVDRTDTCWLWTASTRYGYGRFMLADQRLAMAHRWSYEHHVGPIPDGLQIDHLCRNRACVNPDHLEPVTHGVNNTRRPIPTACPAGHAYTEANAYLYAKRPTSLRATRQCRECDRLRKAAARRTHQMKEAS